MLWWEMLWGAAGITLGCLAWLVILVIRLAGYRAVKTWNLGGPERDQERVS